MNPELESRLTQAPVVPLIQADDPDVAVEVANALVAGGLTVLEVVLRTEAALTCMQHVVAEVPDAIVGAGTVLSVEHAKKSLDAGASFIVSPGLHVPVVETALEAFSEATAAAFSRTTGLTPDLYPCVPSGSARIA